MRGFVSILLFLAIAAAVHIGFPVVLIADEMMAPGLRAGGWIIMYGVGLEPAPGRLVGFEHKGSRYVRRVVGMPGDKVAFKGGKVHVNGAALPLAKAADEEVRFTVSRAEKQGADLKKAKAGRETLAGLTYDVWGPRKPKKKGKTVSVPAGQLFVMCDNRAYCRDSRHFGAIPTDSVWAVR